MSLTPEAIVDAAIALADTHGLEAVTIRRVASALGVTPMALYWYFAKKDDLLDGMVDRVYGEMDLSLDGHERWQDQMRALIEAELAVLREHPALATLVATQGTISPHVLRAIDVALGVLIRAGFSPAEATQIVRHAEQTVVNLVNHEPNPTSALDTDKVQERERQALDLARSLPPDLYPNVIAAAVPLSRCDDPDQYYAFGIDLLLAGINAMARGSSAATE